MRLDVSKVYNLFYILQSFGKRKKGTEAAVDLGCTGWNKTPSTSHDKTFIRISIEKHIDASVNLHCHVDQSRISAIITRQL